MLDLDKGATNTIEFDATVSVDGAVDKFWFYAKRDFADTDANAVIKKGLNVTGLTGIVVTSAAEGKFQVQINPEDTLSLTDKALHYECKYRKSTDGKASRLNSGVLRLEKGTVLVSV